MARIFSRLSDQILADKTGLKHWGQKICEQLEAALTDIEAQVADIAAAQAAASAAQTTANTANTTATAVQKTDKISGSCVVPANVLTAADVGSNCTITIANHTRVYGDGTQLAITGGTITGRAFSTTYAVYYTDTTLADTTPNFLSTTTATNALNNFTTGRHYVGLVTTPADGGAASTGGSSPPGTGGDDRDVFSNL